MPIPAENLLLVNDLFSLLIERIVTEVVKQIDPRLQALEKDSTEVANTMQGINTALDALSDRLETAINDNGWVVPSKFKNMIDAALENYDPTDHHLFGRAVENCVDSFHLESKIKEAIDDMNFQITVR